VISVVTVCIMGAMLGGGEVDVVGNAVSVPVMDDGEAPPDGICFVEDEVDAATTMDAPIGAAPPTTCVVVLSTVTKIGLRAPLLVSQMVLRPAVRSGGMVTRAVIGEDMASVRFKEELEFGETREVSMSAVLSSEFC